MKYSTNYNMNKPELNEQYRLEHWNNNTDIIDTELKRNADNISAETTRANDAETTLRDITDPTFKTALLNYCHPVGSMFWTSKAPNDGGDPNVLFGGTWVQIKNRFIWARGDDDAVNATGGEKTVTLSVENLPSHDHSFTPSGTVSSHSHELNNHTHYFTPSGSVNVTSNPNFSGNAVSDDFYPGQYGVPSDASGTYFKYLNQNTGNQYGRRGTDNSAQGLLRWNYTPSGSISGGSYSFSGSRALTELGGSGSTDSSTPSFSGTAGTTGSTGSGTAINIMPPYIVKYCWERTA